MTEEELQEEIRLLPAIRARQSELMTYVGTAPITTGNVLVWQEAAMEVGRLEDRLKAIDEARRHIPWRKRLKATLAWAGVLALAIPAGAVVTLLVLTVGIVVIQLAAIALPIAALWFLFKPSRSH